MFDVLPGNFCMDIKENFLYWIVKVNTFHKKDMISFAEGGQIWPSPILFLTFSSLLTLQMLYTKFGKIGPVVPEKMPIQPNSFRFFTER